ncbi:MAG: tetratricopeptide repeat protein [Rhodospirillaceae bacterium]|jgi:TPR repeat protein
MQMHNQSRLISQMIAVAAIILTLSGGHHSASATETKAEDGVKLAWQNYLDGKHKLAAKQLKSLADKNNAPAQNYLGTLYASGHGVKANPVQAAKWYERAAKQGFAPAQFNFGFLKLYGAGDGAQRVPDDPKVAAHWLGKSAEQNDSNAQLLLCRLYHQGLGVNRNYKKALGLCRQAAQSGLAGAQFELGILILRSLDTKKFPEAYQWFLLAAKQNFPGAGHNVRLLAKRLKPDEINQVHKNVENWKPAKP